VEVATVVKAVALEMLDSVAGKLQMGNLVVRDFSPAEAKAHDVVDVQLGSGPVPISLDYHMETACLIPDVSKVAEHSELLRTYLLPCGVALSESVESKLLELHTKFGRRNIVLARGNDALDEVGFALDVAFPGSQKRLVVSGAAFAELRKFSRWTESLTDGKLVGKLKDWLVYRSQYIGHVYYHSQGMGFVDGAVGLVVRRPPPIGLPQGSQCLGSEFVSANGLGLKVTANACQLLVQFTTDALFGVGILDARRGFALDFI